MEQNMNKRTKVTLFCCQETLFSQSNLLGLRKYFSKHYGKYRLKAYMTNQIVYFKKSYDFLTL